MLQEAREAIEWADRLHRVLRVVEERYLSGTLDDGSGWDVWEHVRARYDAIAAHPASRNQRIVIERNGGDVRVQDRVDLCGERACVRVVSDWRAPTAAETALYRRWAAGADSVEFLMPVA